MYYHRLQCIAGKELHGSFEDNISDPKSISDRDTRRSVCEINSLLPYYTSTYHRIAISNVHRTMSRHQDFLESEYLAVVCYSSTSPYMGTHNLGNPPRHVTNQPRCEHYSLSYCATRSGPPFWCTPAIMEICNIDYSKRSDSDKDVSFHWYGLVEAVKR